MADLKAGAYAIESMTMRELSVHVVGDAAIATMIGDMKGKYKGADVSASSRSTDFFVKRDGRWQCVASHGSKITEPPSPSCRPTPARSKGHQRGGPRRVLAAVFL